MKLTVFWMGIVGIYASSLTGSASSPLSEHSALQERTYHNQKFRGAAKRHQLDNYVHRPSGVIHERQERNSSVSQRSSRVHPSESRNSKKKLAVCRRHSKCPSRRNRQYYGLWDFGPESFDKVYGTNAGNMFVIEKWMSANWFDNIAPKATDMWGLLLELGEDRAREVLASHYDTWITEEDIQVMAAANLNHLRIPLGFWTFLKPDENEAWSLTSQDDILFYLTRLLGWLADYNMFAILDLHSMPGGQSGDAATGHHQGTNYTFYSPYNQKRSDQVISNVVDFILQSDYGYIVSGVLVVNEPCVNTRCAGGRGNPQNRDILADFYDRSYNTLSEAGIPSLYHHGWAKGGLENWRNFVLERNNPRMLVFTENPYPGAFPDRTDTAAIWRIMCNYINKYKNFPTKVISTEWSVASGTVNVSHWKEVFYNTQASGYTLAGGSCFWSYRVDKSYLSPNPEQWSWKRLYQNGIVPQDFYNFDNRNPGPLLSSLPYVHQCQ